MWQALGALAGGAALNWMSASQTNDANRGMSREQMAWQKEMSDTAHQREVMDLKAAGLNPNLSAGGNGSSTPSGASATMQAPQIAMPDMMAYGISLKQLDLAEQKLNIEKENSAAGIAKTLSETELNKMKKILAQKGMLRAELEGEASSVLSNMIKWLKDSVRQPSLKQRQQNNNQMMPDLPEQPSIRMRGY